MSEPNFVAGKNNLNFNTIVEAIIKRSCIVDFGIIQKVTAGGIVEVAVAVADTPQNVFYMSCVLINIASSSFTIKVEPHIGDRVLVVYPRMYDDTMFSIPDGDKKSEVIVNEKATGYNLSSGLAILMNIVNIEDGKLDIKLAYDEDNDKNMLTFTSDENGAVKFGNDNCSIDIDKDGYLSYKNKKDNKTELTFTSSGATMQDKNGCKIVMDSTYTTINGNLKVKNS